jgi:hypothetical protein
VTFRLLLVGMALALAPWAAWAQVDTEFWFVAP